MTFRFNRKRYFATELNKNTDKLNYYDKQSKTNKC